MSYRPMMKISESETVGNGLRFATRKEAEESALELFSRWTQPIDYSVEESTDPVNYEFVGGRNVHLTN